MPGLPSQPINEPSQPTRVPALGQPIPKVPGGEGATHVATPTVAVSGARVTQTTAAPPIPGDTITVGGNEDDEVGLDAILPDQDDGMPVAVQVGLVAGLAALAVLGAVGLARVAERARGLRQEG